MRLRRSSKADRRSTRVGWERTPPLSPRTLSLKAGRRLCRSASAQIADPWKRGLEMREDAPISGPLTLQ
jgi:hypothetical protein